MLDQQIKLKFDERAQKVKDDIVLTAEQRKAIKDEIWAEKKRLAEELVQKDKEDKLTKVITSEQLLEKRFLNNKKKLKHEL